MQTAARIEEPPGRPQHEANDNPRFSIFEDDLGVWVVHDRRGLVGGMFISESAARHFTARLVRGNRTGTDIVLNPSRINLELKNAA